MGSQIQAQLKVHNTSADVRNSAVNRNSAVDRNTAVNRNTKVGKNTAVDKNTTIDKNSAIDESVMVIDEAVFIPFADSSMTLSDPIFCCGLWSPFALNDFLRISTLALVFTWFESLSERLNRC